MLSTAEMLIGLTRHLGMYAQGPQRAAFGSLEFGGQLLELAVRLQGSGVSPFARVKAIAADAGISEFQLHRQHLPTLEALEWVQIVRKDGDMVAVSENVPPFAELFVLADDILDITTPTPVERAALRLLDATTTLPLTRERAIEVGVEVAPEAEATRALTYLDSLNLVEVAVSDEGVTVVYNPNVWGADADFAAAALRCEDGRVHQALAGLMEEVTSHPGIPESHVMSTEKRWIDFAVARGLVLRSLVVTSAGAEQAFLFTPHMSRNAFGEAVSLDPSGHVRQLIGSMMYATNFARYRLAAPSAFLRKLIRNGEAGDASSIGSDYPMLETAGIVRVEPGDRFYKLVLLQSDVAELALEHIEGADSGPESRLRPGLRDQRRYVHPEQESAQRRVELGRTADAMEEDTARLLAAVRETARGFGRG